MWCITEETLCGNSLEVQREAIEKCQTKSLILKRSNELRSLSGKILKQISERARKAYRWEAQEEDEKHEDMFLHDFFYY